MTLKKGLRKLQGLGMKVQGVSLQRYHKDALKIQVNLFVSNVIIILKPLIDLQISQLVSV